LSDAPGEIALYVHWPYCARICPYCDFNVVRDRGRREEQAALAQAIVADLSAQAQTIGPRRLTSIFFGGGTPSLMDPQWVAAVIEAARAGFAPAPDLEITLEANPTDAEAERFAALAAAGVSRLSLGVQSLDDAALTFLGRNHDAASARRAAETARRAFARLSLDLIYGLPDQSVAAWRADLAAALALGPEHVSAYQLTIEAGTAFERATVRRRWAPPAPDLAAALYEAAGETLQRAGFEAYEVSNHARTHAARSRHNLAYWRGGDWLGVGPGAQGRIGDRTGDRWATLAEIRVASYVARVARTGCGLSLRERLTPREAALERLMMGLRTFEGVALAEVAPLEIAASLIDGFAADGLLSVGDQRIAATPRGRAVLDRLVLELAQGPGSG
jgi:oxygen-independent coproporphyrinogen-3 oxidase